MSTTTLITLGIVAVILGVLIYLAFRKKQLPQDISKTIVETPVPTPVTPSEPIYNPTAPKRTIPQNPLK